MTKATIIGIDLAKSTFQLHGAAGNGAVVFRKKLSRDKLLSFLAGQPAALVAMEACASAHYWGREIATLGHEVKLVPPIYVKPFVKRQSEADQRMIRLLIRPPNDAADAEAIVEAASRPTMRFVEVKTAEQQGQGMLFRTRDLLVRQRTQSINALRGHLAEFGIVAPQGPARVVRLAQAVSDETVSLPDTVRDLARLLPACRPKGRRSGPPCRLFGASLLQTGSSSTRSQHSARKSAPSRRTSGGERRRMRRSRGS